MFPASGPGGGVGLGRGGFGGGGVGVVGGSIGTSVNIVQYNARLCRCRLRSTARPHNTSFATVPHGTYGTVRYRHYRVAHSLPTYLLPTGAVPLKYLPNAINRPPHVSHSPTLLSSPLVWAHPPNTSPRPLATRAVRAWVRSARAVHRSGISKRVNAGFWGGGEAAR